MKIAWLGTGVMGASMAKHLANNNHEVFAYSRTYAKCEALKEFGITPCETIEEAVKDVDIVFTIVGYPKDVEEVYLGENGILAHAKPGTYLVDMTTSSPLLAKKIAEQGKEFKVLDAPVSGGDIGAKNGTLSIMVGGEKADFEFLTPVFECMGKNIIYLGGIGSGQSCKASNQIAIAGTIAGVAESIVFAKQSGLDPNTVLSAISKGAAGSWQMDNNGFKMIEKDYTAGFYNKHFIKDMKIAKEVITEQGIELKVLNTVLEMYESLSCEQFDDEGTQSIIQYYTGK